MSELNRLIRHLISPIVIWLVANGYLPEYMQNDAVEFGVIAMSLVVPLVLSWLRDRRASRPS